MFHSLVKILRQKGLTSNDVQLKSKPLHVIKQIGQVKREEKAVTDIRSVIRCFTA